MPAPAPEPTSRAKTGESVNGIWAGVSMSVVAVTSMVVVVRTFARRVRARRLDSTRASVVEGWWWKGGVESGFGERKRPDYYRSPGFHIASFC